MISAQANRYRTRNTVERTKSVEIVVDNKTLINFSSNDYLGLASHPDLVATLKKAADKYGVGSSASAYVTGFSSAHEKLEATLKAKTGFADVLTFSSGYAANLAAISTLANRESTIAIDRLSHASLYDAAILSRARLRRYAHLDKTQCNSIITSQKNRTFIVTDGVFSMDGDVLPLTDWMQITQANKGVLYIDDAHGFGVLGDNGLGLLDHFNVDSAAVDLYMGTFGKACGVYGAFVGGKKCWIETLKQQARPLIYSTALPPAIAAAAEKGLLLATESGDRRDRLAANVRLFKAAAKEASLSVSASSTAIQPIIVGGDKAALLASKKLMQAGFYVVAIRPPTVPEGTARLRIVLTAGHSEQHIRALVATLADVIQTVD